VSSTTGENPTSNDDHPRKFVPLSRIHVPIVVTIGAAIVLGTSLLSIASTWYRISAHTEDQFVHATPAAALSGGGVAYKGDITAVRNDLRETQMTLEGKIRDEGQRTRRVVGALKINCTGRPGGDLRCTTTVPDPNE
jgi:hypothetical protein